MVFQSIVDLRSGEVVAVEALARFLTRPRRSPDVWFTEATDAGVGVELELAAARRALSFAKRLPTTVRLAINLSPEAICSEHLGPALERVALDRLIIDVTEQRRMIDEERFHATVARWRAGGLLLAVDDVSAEAGAPTRALDVSPDFVKVDVSHTLGITPANARRIMVATLAGVAVGADTAVIATRIESDDQIAALLELGIGLGQGYRLGRPRPLGTGDSSGRLVDRQTVTR